MPCAVLIIAPSNDLHAAAVVDILASRQVTVEWIDFASLNQTTSLTLLLDDSVNSCLVTASGKRIFLSEVNTIWWRRPRLPRDNINLNEETKEFVRDEWLHFLESFEAFAPVRRWVNSPSANRIAGRKGFQLTAARAEGLRIPETIITNDPEAVRSFSVSRKNLIYKRIGSSPLPLTATKALLPSDLERIDVLKNCPAIFQEHIKALLDIRVTIIGDDLYATEIDSQIGSSPIDWRFDHSVPFRPHSLENEISSRLFALMRRLKLVYGAIDMRLTPDGEYIFLEVNPSGQYLFVQLLTETPLSERMADFLTR